MNNGLECFGADLNGAIKSFEKKFYDKTRNQWENRAKFTPVSGKYTLIEMDGSHEEEAPAASVNLDPILFFFDFFFIFDSKSHLEWKCDLILGRNHF